METCAYFWKCPGYAPDRPGPYFGRVFFMEKAPWSISSSLRMKVLDYNRSTISSRTLEL